MKSARTTAVPRDASDVARFVETFTARHGVMPIGGGEGAAAPAITAPPAPAPAPAPAPVAPAPAPAAPQDPAAPAPAAEPAAPPWAQQILDRMDATPQAADPYAVELGLVPAPPAPGQPQLPPQAPASPGPGQQPQAQPGAPFPGLGAPSDPEAQLQSIRDWIDAEVDRRVQSTVDPRFEQLRAQERANEIAGLKSDYPEFSDPATAAEVVQRARQWASLMGNEQLAKEPAFLEMSLLAKRQIDAVRVAQAQGAPQPAVPGVPGSPQPTVPIEAPGVPAPGSPVDPAQAAAQSIVDAGRRGGLSPIWGG